MKQIFMILMTLVIGCASEKNEINRISSVGGKAESVYLTHDRDKNPVVVWTERIGDKVNLHYATSHDDGRSFSDDVKISLDESVATHAEGMPKVAFKHDGTAIVAYEKKAPTQENKYAGAVYYRTSIDNGKSWSAEKVLHNDTTEGLSRSYFDIESLPDGEVGASWLDIKLNNITGGRSVRFAKTNKENKFSGEILIDSSACQCCRVDLYADATGKVNIAYRGLMRSLKGESIRDMKITTSGNNGVSFTMPVRISEDNWNIDGCPHTGPALCGNRENLLALWYTEGNGTGIFYAHREDGQDAFGSKRMLSNSGRHPQVSSNGKTVAVVWEENEDVGGKPITRIQYQTNDGERVEKTVLTQGMPNAYSPVIARTNAGFVIAFLMETAGETGMYIKRF